MSHEDSQHLDWADESSDAPESWADATEDEPKSAWAIPRNHDNADPVDPDLLRDFPQVGEAQGRRSRNDAPRERDHQEYGRPRRDESRDHDREYNRGYNDRDSRDKYDDGRSRDYGGRPDRNYGRDRYGDREGRDREQRDHRDRDYRDSRDHREYGRDSRGYGRNYRDNRDYDREPSYGRERRDDYPPRRRDEREREPTPFPDEAPWTAYVGNLVYQATEDDVARFFEDTGCKVSTIRLLSDKTGRPKGFGYVEFQDADSLRSALQQNDADLLGRPIRIDVAERRKDDRPSTTRFAGGGGGNWRTERPPSQPRRSPQSPQRDDDARPRPTASRGDAAAETPAQAEEKSKKARKGANPFGEAKPRDELEVQKQLQELRAKQAEEARRQKEEALAKRKQQQEEEKPKAAGATGADDKKWRTNKKEGRAAPKAGFAAGSGQGARAANGKRESNAGGRRGGGDSTAGAGRRQPNSNISGIKKDGAARRADDTKGAAQTSGGTKSGDGSWKRGEGAPGTAKRESAPSSKKASTKHAQSAPARPAPQQQQSANSYAVLAEEDA